MSSCDAQMTKKEIRNAFSKGVLKRDRCLCRVCGIDGALDVHHITPREELPAGGYVLQNGITLCPDCHRKAEWWLKYDRDTLKNPDPFRNVPPTTYRPENLYCLIESSLEWARRASMELMACLTGKSTNGCS